MHTCNPPLITRMLACLFVASAVCVPRSPKCHRTTFVKDGETITGTLFRNWVDFDCLDSVARVYCTDTTMRVVPMPGKTLNFLKKDKLIYGSHEWRCFDMPFFRRITDVLYVIDGEVFLKTEVLSMNLAMEKTTTRRLALPPVSWNTKSKLYQIFRTREEFNANLDAELERDHDRELADAERKVFAERQQQVDEYERAQDAAFLGIDADAERTSDAPRAATSDAGSAAASESSAATVAAAGGASDGADADEDLYFL